MESVADIGLDSPRTSGNRNGKGICVSDSFHRALGNARSSLLVTAILEGDHRKFTPKEARSAWMDEVTYNSFSVGHKIVLQSNSQVLPLFVVTCGTPSLNNLETCLPDCVEDITMFYFADALKVHFPLAMKLKNMFPEVAIGILLHLSTQAALHPEPHSWAVDQLTNYNFNDSGDFSDVYLN